MNGLYNIKPIKSAPITQMHLLGAVLVDFGCKVSTMPTEMEGDKDYGLGWQAIKIREIKEMEDLLDIWQNLLKAMNSECWRIGYTIIHCPNNILCKYPDMPCKGFFVAPEDIDLENINAMKLIHTAGQFVEHDTKDKHVWEEWIQSNNE